jgi:hypothetical protein
MGDKMPVTWVKSIKTEYSVCTKCQSPVFHNLAAGRGWLHLYYWHDLTHRAVPVQEQGAGRLASQSKHPGQYVSDNDVIHDDMKTLKDYGLSNKESSRAQELAEHKDLIAKVIGGNEIEPPINKQ